MRGNGHLTNSIADDTMFLMRVVLDTNVIVAAFRSRQGASFQLFSMLGKGWFDAAISAPLAFEYEAALRVNASALGLTPADAEAIVDYLCGVCARHEVFFLWRPSLRDPGDEFILELAVEARCDAIVTHNVKHFDGAKQFGIRILTPAQFLKKVNSES
jgi:predicted nucleic acid-binding protein